MPAIAPLPMLESEVSVVVELGVMDEMEFSLLIEIAELGKTIDDEMDSSFLVDIVEIAGLDGGIGDAAKESGMDVYKMA